MNNQTTSEEQQTEAKVNELQYNPIFPVLTLKVKLALPVEQMEEDILKIAGDQKNYEGGFTTFFNEQALDAVRGITELKQAIYGVSCAYGRELKYETDYDKCAIHLWANVYRKGGYHPPHIHNRSIFSGTFYVRNDENSSPIVMLNPTWDRRMHDPFVRLEDQTAFTSEQLIIKTQPNEMLMWPSWLHHHVPEMQEDGPRISLSFNVDFLPPGIQ